jgi:uncharacterized protein YbaR (Trm112 family)
MLSKELLEILCCPKCHGKIVYHDDRDILTCSSCGQIYKVQNDIPVMLIDDRPSPQSSHG